MADAKREYEPRIADLQAQIDSLKTSSLFSTLGGVAGGALFGIFADRIGR